MNIDALSKYLANPTSWFAVGPMIVAIVYVIFYDALMTLGPNKFSDFWFHRIQLVLKVAVYAAMTAFVLLIGFISWPWNLVLVLAVVVAVIAFIWWFTHREEEKKDKETK